jgi:ATP-dependent RNA helicase DeaD
VGRRHGVLPGNIVGAIAHEADLDGKQINGVDIREDHSLVRLPADLSPKIIAKLRRIKIRGQQLDIEKLPASELPGRDRGGDRNR